jgi:hypothetical protein
VNRNEIQLKTFLSIMAESKKPEAESSGYHENTLPINLPQAFRDLKFAKRMAIDIGEHNLYKFMWKI